ncbi:hypothetical protein F5884DRAFT_873512 [Xylogone sp. PMI_703]|nr:hypothetical protein F5884DRAFT_873512 [Xylogone sp. PMI_703]
MHRRPRKTAMSSSEWGGLWWVDWTIGGSGLGKLGGMAEEGQKGSLVQFSSLAVFFAVWCPTTPSRCNFRTSCLDRKESSNAERLDNLDETAELRLMAKGDGGNNSDPLLLGPGLLAAQVATQGLLKKSRPLTTTHDHLRALEGGIGLWPVHPFLGAANYYYRHTEREDVGGLWGSKKLIAIIKHALAHLGAAQSGSYCSEQYSQSRPAAPCHKLRCEVRSCTHTGSVAEDEGFASPGQAMVIGSKARLGVLLRSPDGRTVSSGFPQRAAEGVRDGGGKGSCKTGSTPALCRATAGHDDARKGHSGPCSWEACRLCGA